MNIFYFDIDTKLIAEDLCDKHLRKALLETVQMISTIAVRQGFDAPYKPTHQNHPCTLWVGMNRKTFGWMRLYARDLCAEYQHRFKKKHKSEYALLSMDLLGIKKSLPAGDWVTPPLCMPEEFKPEFEREAAYAYMLYYSIAKASICGGYTNREKPGWIDDIRDRSGRQFPNYIIPNGE